MCRVGRQTLLYLWYTVITPINCLSVKLLVIYVACVYCVGRNVDVRWNAALLWQLLLSRTDW